MIKIKRIYELYSKEDGTRLFIDRLWPRGISKSKLKAEWIKDIAPSNELRTWFAHDKDKWKDFKKRYIIELKNKKELTDYINGLSKKGIVTLLYAAKDTAHNEAIVLKEYLESKKI